MKVIDDVDLLLSPAAPSIPLLKELTMEFMEMEGFSSSLATALQSLTSLDLSFNKFTHLPAALSHITALKLLRIARNSCFQLIRADLATLAALTQLKVLDIQMENSLESSVKCSACLSAIKSRLPSLHIQLDMPMFPQLVLD